MAPARGRRPGVAALVGAILLMGCSSPPGDVGEACRTSDNCLEGLTCTDRAGAEVTPVCMADCDPSTDRLCSDGTVCIGFEDEEELEGGVCYLGGETAIGAPCELATDCVPGAVCVLDGATDEQTCFGACRTDDDTCPEGESCQAVEDSDFAGFCR
ncbi:MAG: hypothetical protein ACFCGT_19385 [Sandaracinaceae bacterium]